MQSKEKPGLLKRFNFFGSFSLFPISPGHTPANTPSNSNPTSPRNTLDAQIKQPCLFFDTPTDVGIINVIKMQFIPPEFCVASDNFNCDQFYNETKIKLKQLEFFTKQKNSKEGHLTLKQALEKLRDSLKDFMLSDDYTNVIAPIAKFYFADLLIKLSPTFPKSDSNNEQIQLSAEKTIDDWITYLGPQGFDKLLDAEIEAHIKKTPRKVDLHKDFSILETVNLLLGNREFAGAIATKIEHLFIKTKQYLDLERQYAKILKKLSEKMLTTMDENLDEDLSSLQQQSKNFEAKINELEGNVQKYTAKEKREKLFIPHEFISKLKKSNIIEERINLTSGLFATYVPISSLIDTINSIQTACEKMEKENKKNNPIGKQELSNKIERKESLYMGLANNEDPFAVSFASGLGNLCQQLANLKPLLPGGGKFTALIINFENLLSVIHNALPKGTSAYAEEAEKNYNQKKVIQKVNSMTPEELRKLCESLNGSVHSFVK